MGTFNNIKEEINALRASSEAPFNHEEFCYWFYSKMQEAEKSKQIDEETLKILLNCLIDFFKIETTQTIDEILKEGNVMLLVPQAIDLNKFKDIIAFYLFGIKKIKIEHNLFNKEAWNIFGYSKDFNFQTEYRVSFPRNCGKLAFQDKYKNQIIIHNLKTI